MKSILVLIAVTFLLTTSGWAKFAMTKVNSNLIKIQVACYYSSHMMTMDSSVTQEQAAESAKAGNKSSANTQMQNNNKSIANQMKNSARNNNSGQFGIDHLRLDTNYNYTQFNDSSIDANADVEDFNLTLSGDISEKLSFTLGYNYNRLDTDKGIDIVIESEGVNGSLLYRINENYGFGGFASYNWVDIENVNGNSFAWATGIFFTTSHDLDIFTLTTVTSLYHIDYDSDHDHFASLLVDVSRQWNDWFNTFAFISYTDALRDSDHNNSDNSYFNWGLGFEVQATDSLSFRFSYDSTESIHNYNDQTFSLNVGYTF